MPISKTLDPSSLQQLIETENEFHRMEEICNSVRELYPEMMKMSPFKQITDPILSERMESLDMIQKERRKKMMENFQTALNKILTTNLEVKHTSLLPTPPDFEKLPVQHEKETDTCSFDLEEYMMNQEEQSLVIELCQSSRKRRQDQEECEVQSVSIRDGLEQIKKNKIARKTDVNSKEILKKRNKNSRYKLPPRFQKLLNNDPSFNARSD